MSDHCHAEHLKTFCCATILIFTLRLRTAPSVESARHNINNENQLQLYTHCHTPISGLSSTWLKRVSNREGWPSTWPRWTRCWRWMRWTLTAQFSQAWRGRLWTPTCATLVSGSLLVRSLPLAPTVSSSVSLMLRYNASLCVVRF